MRNLFLLSLVFFLAACMPSLEPKPVDPLPPAAETPAQPGPDSPVCSGADCPQPAEPPMSDYAPRDGDDALTRGQVYDLQAEILILESFPPQIMLRLNGSLPTPCHQLRVNAAAPETDGKINVEVYSLVDSNTICVQSLAPFEVSIPLGSPPTGKYQVLVNSQSAGEFEMP
mgnify:CR=1 FL=1